MQQRRYGANDLTLSEITFGTMRFVPKEARTADEARDGMRALEAALDAGIDTIHSSYEYGTRWAVGEVLAQRPDRHEVKHVVKVNVPDWGEARFDKAAFRRQVEDALRELHADRLAVVQHLQRGDFPKPQGYRQEAEPRRIDDLDAILEPLQEVVAELRAEGAMDRLATFPYTSGYGRAALDTGVFDGIVAFHDAVETDLVDLFEDLRANGRGFIGIRPLLGGVLTDARHDRSNLPENDPRRATEWDLVYDRVARLKAALGEQIDSWTEFSLQFALADPIATSTVLGFHRTDQVEAARAALDRRRRGPDVVAEVHELLRDLRDPNRVDANPSGLPVYAPDPA